MVTSESVTQEEFDALPHSDGGAGRTEEGKLILALEPLTGIKFPCRWNHSGKSTACNGLTNFRGSWKRHGLDAKGRCRDGTVYVFRYE
jgi:hypothetical protein